ncbi:MAG: fructose-bisphosphatase class II, partial [Roseovarius sp.]|nr:fructose-bisphosphatase class II [Roseovarius sp.]
MPSDIAFNDRLLSLGLARVSEAAALACADLIGRGDEKAADQAAVNAMRDGAYDFITKPLNLDRLSLLVKRALANRELIMQHRALQDEIN